MIRAAIVTVGCWVSSWHGQYAGAALILAATAYGFSDSAAIALARRHYDSMSGSRSEPISDDEHETLMEGVDMCEQWLNAHVAQPGHAFGWHDGDFFYQPDAWWEEL